MYEKMHDIQSNGPAFEWDPAKDTLNKAKHGLGFEAARQAFFDPHRVILEDPGHSAAEARFLCVGRVGGGIATVRFTLRGDSIRNFGAGYWREGRRIYEKEHPLH